MRNLKVNEDYEMKNDWLFVDNHPEKKVYCPFCGKDLTDGIFTVGGTGLGGVDDTGLHCDNCNIDVFTYRVVDCEEPKIESKDDTEYGVHVDYIEGDLKTYKGTFVTRDMKEIFRCNIGDYKKDYELCSMFVWEFTNEFDRFSSCDNYEMDLDYENDPEYRADVDKTNKEMDEKIEAYKKELGKDELTIEEMNYIWNKRN